MPYTDFPNGVTSFGIPLIGSSNAIPVTDGNYWFVSSLGGTGGFGDGTSMTAPVASLATAMSKAVAGNDDVIVCMPGHAESITSATAMPFNKSGVRVVGLGQGSLRPTFTISTANTATIAVSADDMGVSNCIFKANFLSIAACFTLTTAKNFNLDSNLFTETSGILNFLNIVKSTGAANTIDGITCTNNQWAGLGTTSVSTFCLSANDIDRGTFIGNTIINATTTNIASLLVVSAGVVTNLMAGYNRTYRKNTTSTASLISVGGTTSTGIVFNNYTQTLDTATNVLFATTVGLAAFNNYITGVTGASGFLIPTADS